MTVRHKKAKRVTPRVKLCTSFFEQATGLMFRPKQHNRAFVFPFSRPRPLSIHMLFVFHSIDILVLDDSRRIIAIKEGLRPFRMYTPLLRCSSFIELGAGNVKEHNIHIGDYVEWNEKGLFIYS